MAIQHSAALRNARRDVYVAAFPAGTLLQIRTGAPAGVANAVGGTLLAEATLPATPFATTTGEVNRNGVWQTAPAVASGTAEHYRLVDGAYIEEGLIAQTGSPGDLILDNTDFEIGQQATIAAWTRTEPGA